MYNKYWRRVWRQTIKLTKIFDFFNVDVATLVYCQELNLNSHYIILFTHRTCGLIVSTPEMYTISVYCCIIECIIDLRRLSMLLSTCLWSFTNLRFKHDNIMLCSGWWKIDKLIFLFQSNKMLNKINVWFLVISSLTSN